MSQLPDALVVVEAAAAVVVDDGLFEFEPLVGLATVDIVVGAFTLPVAAGVVVDSETVDFDEGLVPSLAAVLLGAVLLFPHDPLELLEPLQSATAGPGIVYGFPLLYGEPSAP